MNEPEYLAAGDFSAWLLHTRNSLLSGIGTDVACGECIGCCSSSYFIHIKPHETQTLSRIRKDMLVAAPGLPVGNVLMGYDKEGRCPMLSDRQCTIYADRPHTCRHYDCRIFTAAGIAAGNTDKDQINQRVQRWRFSYPAASDRAEHEAVMNAAAFRRQHATSFPGGRVPDNPSQLAILALKVYTVFLDNAIESKTASASRNALTAKAIMEASR
jgi:uncharacterized protein